MLLLMQLGKVRVAATRIGPPTIHLRQSNRIQIESSRNQIENKSKIYKLMCRQSTAGRTDMPVGHAPCEILVC